MKIKQVHQNTYIYYGFDAKYKDLMLNVKYLGKMQCKNAVTKCTEYEIRILTQNK